MIASRWPILLGMMLFAGLMAGLDFALAAGAPAMPAAASSLAMHAEYFAGGLSQPTDLAFTGLPSDTRMFVAELPGLIRIVLSDGAVLPTPFLDISATVDSQSDSENGLLGLAFDPAYASNGNFYVFYTGSGAQDGVVLRLSRFHVSADPNVAEPAETSVLTIPHPYAYNHTGGQIRFGADGDLYLGPGDGGLINQYGDPSVNAQRLSGLLGKLLRINVSGVPTYTIPASNPFTQTAGARPEIWALGLRNPWRFSFDRLTHDLYIGDVGQNAWEEVDFAPHASPGGENYGWNCYEGSHVYTPSACAPGGTIFPVAEYSHTGGNRAIIGGFVYRGSAMPALYGQYVFADFGSGHFWAMRPGAWQVTPLGSLVNAPTTFGEGPAGELYVASTISGNIDRLVGGPLPYAVYLPSVGRQ